MHAGRAAGAQLGGFLVAPDHGPEILRTADTVIVPGVHGGASLTGGHPRTARWPPRWPVRRRGARLMSICTGAFVLAALGVLDGRPATTHWLWATVSARCTRACGWTRTSCSSTTATC